MAIEMTVSEIGAVSISEGELSRLLNSHAVMIAVGRGRDLAKELARESLDEDSLLLIAAAMQSIDLTKLMSEISDLRVAVIEREREC